MNMNMTTSIENIPMKTSKTNMNDIDDSEDPMVKDILQEFQQELKENQKSSLPQQPSLNQNNYEINYNPPPQLPQQSPQQTQPKPKNKNDIFSKYYNQEVFIKTAIIITIIAFVFSPTIFNTILDKIPSTFSQLLNQYEFYIKIIIAFIFIYLYNLF